VVRASGRWPGLLLVVASLLGCGEAPEAEPEQAPWSAPSAGVPPSPEGGGVVPRSPAEVLADLRRRLAGGGSPDSSFEREAFAVAETLWPPEEGRGAGPRAHLDLARTAGEVGRWLAEGPEARARLSASHPTDLEIHDALLRALSLSPAAYRAWCEGEGAKLRERHVEARRAQLFGER
jgi:hypothetical protein